MLQETTSETKIRYMSKSKIKAKPNMNTKRDRQMFTLLRIIRGYKATEIAKRSKVSASTVYKWRKDPLNGGTMYPKMHTMLTVLSAFGYDMEIVEKSHKKK